MKLFECKDWEVVQIGKQIIYRWDRNLYPMAMWWKLIHEVEVEPMNEHGHYKDI